MHGLDREETQGSSAASQTLTASVHCFLLDLRFFAKRSRLRISAAEKVFDAFLRDCDVDGMMFIYDDYLAVLRVTGREILPRLRRKFA